MHPLARRLPPTVFSYRNGSLVLDGVPLSRIAAEVGTPVYVYSAARLRERWHALAGALAPLGVSIHYAMKANANRAVLTTFAALGAGVDIVSGGELERALAAGFSPDRVVFSGVGKTADEIDTALRLGVHQINAESFEELAMVDRRAAASGRRAPVAIRVNPDVDAGTHAKIATGRRGDKFGIPLDELMARADALAGLPRTDLVGLAVHIGSQVMSEAPFRAAYARVAEAVRALRSRGFPLRRLDLGGGFGVAYQNELEFRPADLARVLRDTVGDLGAALAIEPGRTLVADAGVLLVRVTLVKESHHTRFLVVDAAMNDLARPAIYDAHHDVVPVTEPAPGSPLGEVDVVGPICESSDVFGRRRPLPLVEPGDLVVFATAGAYGAVMSSTYNGRPLVPEVIVDGGRFAVTRRRVTVQEQLGWESAPDWLAAGPAPRQRTVTA